ncbi:MAG: hypothetical protein ACREV3_02990 [Gammaproteobacteria bacterium]
MAQHSENANTFRAVALEWIAKKHRDGRLTTYIKLSEGSMLMCSPESATYRSAV